jgi:purine-nucleoside phosphorylase
MDHQIAEAVSFLKAQSGFAAPDIALILGSGLGSLADEIEGIRIDYADIPHFPRSTVEGHAGKLVIGKLEGRNVIALQGRFHYYEGYTLQQITFPVRVFHALGVKSMIVTNACGGLMPHLYPGALMLISDHINFLGGNPLMGPNVGPGPRFPDMSTAYDPAYRDLARKVADRLGIQVEEGIYTAVTGPYYCSKAELAMVRGFGSDTIGMSTVPEVIVAVHCGIRVLGIACVTDMAIPETLSPPSHEHVVRVANETRPKFEKLVKGCVGGM